MKKILFLILAFAITFSACKKDEGAVSKVVELSYPEITLNGEKFVSLMVGESYNDPGAISTDDVTGAKTDLMASTSTLDINTPGLYYMGYTAKNANGYITNVARYIAVTDYQDDVDLTGVYQRTSNGIEVNISKVSRGMYMNDDMGGAGLSDAAYFAVINDSTIDLGLQLSESIGAEIDGVSEDLIIVDPDDITIRYALDAPGYGTAVRTFIKVQ